MEVASLQSNSMMGSTDDLRKNTFKKGGQDIIKSPYNKVNVKDIEFKPRQKKKIIKGFPTEIDINKFLRQLTFKRLTQLSTKFLDKVSSLKDTVSYGYYKKCLYDVFDPPPADSLRDLLYKRFKPLKFTDDGKELDVDNQEMVILDFLIALALLSRAISKYNDKLKLIFNFCDDDGDHCMKPEEILFMIQRLERIFCKECSRINLDSQLLLQSIADKRAETRFHYLIQIIRRKNNQHEVDE